MENKKTLTIMTILMALMGAFASLMGLVPMDNNAPETIETIRGEIVELDGYGLYAWESVSLASQGRAQDVVTIIVGVPLLVISFILWRKGSQRAAVIYGGTVGYFLYTYASYCFLISYNNLFLFYTWLLTISIFTFILVLQQLAKSDLAERMAENFKRKTIAIYLFFVGSAIFLMWIGRLAPSLLGDAIPFGLEHYTTLVIQILDLGIVVPAVLFTAVLLLQKRKWGYLLSGIVMMKALTMLLAIMAMVVGMYVAGADMGPSAFVEIGAFLGITIANSLFLIPVIKSIPKS